MISLPVGARIVRSYDSEMPGAGKGVLYLLNTGMMFEGKGKGVVFECSFDSLASFEATKKDRLLVAVRTPQGNRSIQFKVKAAGQIESEIADINRMYADCDTAESGTVKATKFDQDAFSLSEAGWFKVNWDRITGFLRPERASFLNEFVGNVRVGSPNVDPYLLVVDHENLTYRDFEDLPGFLRWRYQDMTDNEVKMIISILQDFPSITVTAIEMQVQRASQSKNYVKYGQSLYERVAMVSRDAAEKMKNHQLVESK